MRSESIKEILTIVTTIFVFTAALVPFIKNMAIHIGAIDETNKRKVHTGIMPRMGGLAIFFGFLLGYMIFSKQSIQMNAILIGSFLVILTGVIDDIKPLKPSIKFAGQLLGALVVAVYGGITLDQISSSYISINFGIFTYPITLLFILTIVNAINFIDGLDGLASGTSSIFFLTVGIIAIILNKTNGLDVTLSFIMLGATLGFLVHNFHPAKIFLGDTGSMFLGFIISVIALIGFKNVTLTSFIIPVLILGVPLLDTLFAILRRVLKGESISKPDKEHLHHQFLKLKFSHRNTVLLIYLINSLFAMASILYILKDKALGKLIYIVILILWLAIVVLTDIISDNQKIRDKFKNRK